MTRAADRALVRGRPSSPRRGLLAACTVLVLAAPGCSLRFGRTDGPPSLRFAAGTIADRTADDASTTADWFGSWPSRIADDFAEAPVRLQSTCDLYFGD